MNSKICKYCNKEFVKPLSYNNNQWENKIYCSCKCSAKDLTKRKKRHLFEKGHEVSQETKEKISLKLMDNNNGAGNKGKKRTEGTKEKISKELKKQYKNGDRIAPWTNKKRLSITGENHYNWKGGVVTEEKKERQRFKRILQPKILKRDDYICQICRERGGKLQVDHIKSWKDYPKLRFVENNCRTLCMGCHYWVTYGKKMPSNIKLWGHNLKYFEGRAD